MRAVRFDLNQTVEVRGRGLLRRLRRTVAAGFAVGLAMTAAAPRAQAFDWNAVAQAVGAAVGAALTGERSTDSERAGAAALGAGVVEVLRAGITGRAPSEQEKLDVQGRAAAAGLGAMLADKDSDPAVKALAAGGGVLVYEGVKAVYRDYTGDAGQSGRSYGQESGALGRTQCRKVLVRVVDGGKLVQERIEERCEAQKTEPGYMGDRRFWPSAELNR